MSFSDEVRNYYDRNTRLFLRFSNSAATETIHRALWPPAVRGLPTALHVSTELILAESRASHAEHLLDLGCGVGASLFYLLGRLPGAEGVGLTISPLQACLAARHRPSKAAILEADFQFLPLSTSFDMAYSIEAFVHASDPDLYLSEAVRVLRPGGRLILIDDFLGQVDSTWREAYQRGWHAPNLQNPANLEQQAARHGLSLVQLQNLTPLLHLRALPDWLARCLLKIFHRLSHLHPIVPSMLGSMALQQCIRAGAIQYQMLVFTKITQ